MSEPFVFVVWERARGSGERILADLARRFELCDVVELTWPGAAFSRQLTRVYGEALRAGSSKEVECGTGPFLVIVGVDRVPRYRLRRKTRAWARVNTRLAAAKRRYRRWAGGGFRVHGSLDRAEGERDLQLFLGVGGDELAGRRFDGTIRSLVVDEVVWRDAAALLAAVTAATPAVLVDAGTETIRIRAADVWWAAVIAGGDPPEGSASRAALTTRIGGRATRVEIEELSAPAATPPPA